MGCSLAIHKKIRIFAAKRKISSYIKLNNIKLMKKTLSLLSLLLLGVFGVNAQTLWENGETTTEESKKVITLDVSSFGLAIDDTIRVDFVSAVNARAGETRRVIQAASIELRTEADLLAEATELKLTDTSVDFVIDAAMAEKLEGVSQLKLCYQNVNVTKVELKKLFVPTTTATFDFASPTIREKIGAAMTDVAGYIYNETFTVDGVSLQVTAGSAPSRIYVDNNRGQNLVTYKDYTTLTFRAPEGKAITKLEFTAAGNSNIKSFTASSGAIDGMVWSGNAEGVRFAQGGTSYLANVIVTLIDKNAQTTTLPEINYVECANIAAFNALENGTFAKLTLTDAEIIGISADGYSTVFIQDATGGCWIQYTSLNAALQEKTKVSGTVYVAKRVASGNTQMKETEDTPKSAIEASPVETFSMVEGTIAEVNVAANLGKVVKITGATLTETNATAGTLTQGDASISVNNGTETANQQLHKIAEWEKDRVLENVTIVAVLVAKSASENQLLPLSVVKDEPTGISRVDAAAGNVTIYSLQGVRMNQLQKGLNIVNGRKIVR